jgi:septum formation protein
MAATAERLILASASAARARMLEAAGVTFTIERAAIDEARIKTAALEAGQAAIACALALAAGKARTVSRRHPEALVIGADQILVIESEWFDKPRDLGDARAHSCSRGLAATISPFSACRCWSYSIFCGIAARF